MADSPQFVPARYIGHHPVRLVKGLRPYLDLDGKPLGKLILEVGDTLLMPAAEILGQTYLYDPRGVADPKYLGAGKRVLPEHADKDDRELSLLGYEFHEGRSDFELVQEEVASAPQATPTEQAEPSSVEHAPQPATRVALGG